MEKAATQFPPRILQNSGIYVIRCLCKSGGEDESKDRKAGQILRAHYHSPWLGAASSNPADSRLFSKEDKIKSLWKGSSGKIWGHRYHTETRRIQNNIQSTETPAVLPPWFLGCWQPDLYYPPPPIPKEKAEDTFQESLTSFKNNPIRSSYSWWVPLRSLELSISIQVRP